MNFHLVRENPASESCEKYFLLIIVIFNLLLKAVPAGILELGNDEVYYWTYALYPGWSHFDHPPMIGLLIQLFTLDLSLPGELFIRAGALVLSSASIILLYRLVKSLYSVLAAYIAVIIYVSSIYFNLISGLFILPDSPQNFFILLSLTFLLPSLTSREPSARDLRNIVLFGLFTGLAFLSKYQSLFLWLGAGLYILFHNRTWMKKPALYISILFTLVLMVPVIYWNYINDFISFTYHGGRVGLSGNSINLVYFLRFNAGQFFYQNPILSVIYLVSLYRIIFRPGQNISEVNLALLYLGIPLIAIFTFFSLFRNTLPHWSGPAFICLIMLSSSYLSDVFDKRKRLIKGALSSAALIFVFVLLLGTVQIKTGLIKLQKDYESAYPGKNDFTLDMYGWKQAREEFSGFLQQKGISENEHERLAIITDNWFPAAHLDYYVAYPLKIKLLALGKIERIHKYYWINKKRRLRISDRIFYITDSRNYDPPEKLARCFSGIVPDDTLIISRNRKTVKKIFIYDLTGLKCDSSLYSPDPGF